MKKFLLFIASVLIFASINEVYSQSCCPSGLYTQITVTNVTHPASGCKFSITYCYYDGPGGDRKLFICNINVDASQSCNYNNFILNSSFWSFVDEVVRYDLHSRDPFDPCVEGGGQTNMIVESSKAKCQKVYYDMILDAYIVEACDAEPGLCVLVYSICASNGSLNKTDISGPTYIGGGDCPTTPPNINSNTPTCFNTCQ